MSPERVTGINYKPCLAVRRMYLAIGLMGLDRPGSQEDAGDDCNEKKESGTRKREDPLNRH